MRLRDVYQETYEALSGNRIRSGLTMLGIVIGISSVIALVAIGEGAQQSIQSNIEAIGSNLVLVTPGAQRGPGAQVNAARGSARTLKNDDAEAIKLRVDGVKEVTADLVGRYQVSADGANTNTQVAGVTETYGGVRNIEVEEGSFVSAMHLKTLAKVAIIGPTVRDDLFGEGAEVVGQSIRIKQIQFKIIGVTKTKGGSGFGNQDDIIYIPLTSAQRFLVGDDYLSSISVQAENPEVMAAVQQDVTTLLLARHNIRNLEDADFSTFNQEDIVAVASTVTGTFTILLGAVAGISLLVGGIGIMNMMLTTVTERTREIGLRKAIGAKRKDISLQFLVESIALTFIGGLIGVILGWLVAFAVSYFGIIQTSVSAGSIVLAFGVSAAIGIVFGYYPAQRAAKLNPIEALRYE